MATIERVGLELDSRGAEANAKRFDESITKAARSLDTLDRGLSSSEKRIRKTAKETGGLEKEMRLLVRAQVNQSTQTKRLTTQLFRMEKALRGAATEESRLGAASGRATAGLASVARGAGRTQAAMRGLAGPVTRIAALFGAGFGARAAIGALSSFEKTLATVGVVSNASEQQLTRLRRSAADLGATTEFTATAAGEGLLFLARAGFEVDEAIAALPQTLDLATVGALELGQAADIASNVLAQFGLSVLDLERVTDALVNVSNNANTSVQQLAEGLSYAGPIAGSLAISVEETAAALGVLGDSGIQASQAGTNLRGIFAALQSAAPDARKALVDLDVSLQGLDPSAQDLDKVLRKLSDAGLDAATAFDVFGRRNAAAVLTLTRGVGKFDELIAKNRELAGSTREGAETIRETFAGSINTLTSTLEAAVLASGEDGLTGTLNDLTQGTTETIRKLFDLESATDDFGVVTDVAATAVEALAIALALQGAASFLSFTTSAVRGLTSMVIALNTATASQKALNLAFSRSLPGLVATAVLGLAIAWRTFARDADAAEQQIRRNNTAMDRATESAQTFAEAIAAASVGRDIDSQISRLETYEAALISLATTIKNSRTQGAFDDPADLLTTEGRLNSLLDKLRDLDAQSRRGVTESGDQVVVRSGRVQEQIEGIRKEIELIETTIAAGFTVDGAAFVSVDDPRLAALSEALKDAGLNAEAYEDAVRKSTGATAGAFRGQVVNVGLLVDAIRDLAKEARDTADELQKLADDDAQKAADDYALALKSISSDLEQAESVLQRRTELLGQVRDGDLSLADAERTLADELKVAGEVAKLVQGAERDGIVVSEKAQAVAEARVIALQKQTRELDENAESIRNVEQAESTLLQQGQALLDALTAEADALRAVDPLQAAVVSTLDLMAIATGEGAKGFDELAAKIRDAADALRDAQDAAQDSTEAKAFRGLQDQLGRDLERIQAGPGGQARFRAEDALTSAGIEDPTGDQVADIVKRLKAIAEAEAAAADATDELERKARQIEFVSEGFASAISDAVLALATGAADITDIGASLLQELQQVALEAFIGEPLKDALKSAIASFLRNERGNVFTGGGVQPFFQGGVVDRPGLFSFGQNRVGSIAEVEPEGIFPLGRDATGKLGIRGSKSITFAPRMNVVVNGGNPASVGDAMRKSQRMMMRDLQRRMREQN